MSSLAEKVFSMIDFSICKKEKIWAQKTSWFRCGHHYFNLITLYLIHFHFDIFKTVSFKWKFLVKLQITSESRQKHVSSVWICGCWPVGMASCKFSLLSEYFIFLEISSEIIQVSSLLFIIEVIVRVLLNIYLLMELIRLGVMKENSLFVSKSVDIWLMKICWSMHHIQDVICNLFNFLNWVLKE